MSVPKVSRRPQPFAPPQAPPVQTLRRVFLDMAFENEFRIERPLAALASAGWRKRPDSVRRLARRVSYSDADCRLTRAKVRERRSVEFSEGRGRRYPPWVGEEGSHKSVFLDHPEVNCAYVSLLGLDRSERRSPFRTSAAIHVFGFRSSGNHKLLDPRDLAPAFDWTTRDPRGFTTWTISDSYTHGHYRSFGRDTFELMLAIRDFDRNLLPNLSLPVTCTLYSVGKVQMAP